jgi:caa(3)-type oxidase subunit IV
MDPAAEQIEDHEEHGDHLAQYWRTIITLSVLTAIEFAIAFAIQPGDDGTSAIPFVVGVLIMLALAAWKAVLVGKVFMHLSYDPKLLAWIAVSPVILGAPLVGLVCFDAIQGPWQV